MKNMNLAMMMMAATMSVTPAQASKMCQNMERFPVAAADAAKASKNNLDVIWVIDDSSSMGNHQQNLKNNLNSFFSVLDQNGKVDFQMGVVTTGLTVVKNASGAPMILNSGNATANRAAFMQAMMVGTKGSATEKGSEAFLKFIASQPDFIRQKSHVSINILSDEDDETASDKVALMRETVQFLKQQGNSVSINLIGLQDQITRYSANFEGMEMNFFPINGAGFSRAIEAIAKKSIRSPTENFELKFDAREILSVELIKQGKTSEIENFQIVDANSIHIDFGKSKIAKGSEIEVQYRYDCSAFDRNETKELAKMIAEIEFRPNSSAFLNEAEASRIIDQVVAFMKKHEDANISLIGVSSFSINPFTWLKILPFEDRPLARARNLAKSRAATIKKTLSQKGIEEHRMEAKGAFPGLHRHWYSYLLDASSIDVIPFIDMAGMIQSDRRVVLKVSQGI